MLPDRNCIRPPARGRMLPSSLLGGLFLFIQISSAGAVPRLTIDRCRDSAYLPYRLKILWSSKPSSTQPPVLHRSQVLRPARPNHPGSFVTIYNSSIFTDGPATVNLNSFPVVQLVRDMSVPMTVRDFGVYTDHAACLPAAAVTGFRNDSAFIVRVFPERGTKSSCFLASGRDRRWDGMWEPELDLVALGDYDCDGRNEAFVFVNSQREYSLRVLVCVELETLRIEWKLPVSSLVLPGNVLMPQDPHDPSIIFTSYNPKQGVCDSVFSDSYAYITKVDTHGRIVWNYLCAVNHLDCRSVISENDRRIYISHEVSLSNPRDPPPLTDGTYRLSALSFDGTLLASRRIDKQPLAIWLRQYDPARKKLPHVQFQAGFQRVYDSALNLVAESDSVGRLSFLGMVKIADFVDSIIVFHDGIYTQDLRELAAFPEVASTFDVLGYDDDSNARSLLVCADQTYILEVTKKTLADLAGVFYIRHQKLIITILSGLLVAIVLVNYYRHKNKARIRLIAVQRDELSRAHAALKEAQKTIIAQEKFRQAKNIAGGFAHEIRNALFPAEATINRHLTGTRGSVMNDSDKQHMNMIADAINRAIDLTELILTYTRLDGTHPCEDVDLGRTIQTVISANRFRLEESDVRVDCMLPDELVVRGNPRRLESVFNNLLLNSLDALAGVDQPRITVRAVADLATVCVSVTDNGCGIEPQHLPHVFETFFSTKPDSGTGLGLAITRKIVEMCGGDITIRSEPKRGTQVHVTLLKEGCASGNDDNGNGQPQVYSSAR